MLYESALVRSGYEVPDSAMFAKHIERLVGDSLKANEAKTATTESKTATEATESNKATESKATENAEPAENEGHDEL